VIYAEKNFNKHFADCVRPYGIVGIGRLCSHSEKFRFVMLFRIDKDNKFRDVVKFTLFSLGLHNVTRNEVTFADEGRRKEVNLTVARYTSWFLTRI
jgi:hypothetical protein